MTASCHRPSHFTAVTKLNCVCDHVSAAKKQSLCSGCLLQPRCSLTMRERCRVLLWKAVMAARGVWVSLALSPIPLGVPLGAHVMDHLRRGTGVMSKQHEGGLCSHGIVCLEISFHFVSN